MKPLCIAHRGDTNHFRENTIHAFDSAFELGADGIECDVQVYKEKLIVVHNYLFDQTKQYPLLQDVLEQFSHKGRIEIEIKSFSLDFLPLLEKVLLPYEKRDIEVTSSVMYLFPYLRKVFPTLSLGVIFQSYEFELWMTEAFIQRKILEVMQTLGAHVAHIPPHSITANLVEAIHRRGMKVHGHIPKKEMSEQVKLYHTFVAMEVDQCTFDDISLLKGLNSKGS